MVSNAYSIYNGKYISSVSYYYNDAVAHRQGLGFCGFRKIRIYDNNRGIQTEQTFDPMKFGFITQVVTPTAESSYNFHMVTLSNKVVRMISSSKVEKDKLKNVTVNSSCVYDVYSNVTKETSVYSDGLTITTDNSYQNIDNGTTYRIGLLYDQVTTKTKDGLTWVGRNYIPVFDNNQLPIVTVNYVNGKSASQVNRSYKDGLVTQEFLKEYGATTSLKTLYEYDSYGRVIKKTTPLNFVSTYTYNPKGLLYSVKIIKNRKPRSNMMIGVEK